MKTIFLFVFCFVSAHVYALQPERRGTLEAKIILANGQGYYVLDDNTCLKVVGFSKRWRSLREWWHSVQLVVPKAFLCTPNEWETGASIELYAKRDFPGIPEENASNKDMLNSCTHVLINSGTQQVLFGRALATSACMAQLFKAGYSEGYTSGYGVGYALGYSNGYREGYDRATKNR